MKDPIAQHLKRINCLSIKTALWVFRKSFDNFYHRVSKLPLDNIDTLVRELHNQEIKEYWIRQKRMKYPHLFFYGMFSRFKIKTLQEKKCQRESIQSRTIPNSKNDYGKHAIIAKQVFKHAMSLPPDKGVAFLGELVGTWMLKCPEVIIRSENHVEYIGTWVTKRETTDWEIPISWLEKNTLDNGSRKVRDRELQLIYVLDFMFYLYFDDYDMANTC